MDKEAELIERRKSIIAGLEKSYQKLVEFKRYKKSPLIVSKDGKVVEIAPEKIAPSTRYLTNNDI